jgi:hypothetical protein
VVFLDAVLPNHFSGIQFIGLPTTIYAPHKPHLLEAFLFILLIITIYIVPTIFFTFDFKELIIEKLPKDVAYVVHI